MAILAEGQNPYGDGGVVSRRHARQLTITIHDSQAGGHRVAHDPSVRFADTSPRKAWGGEEPPQMTSSFPSLREA